MIKDAVKGKGIRECGRSSCGHVQCFNGGICIHSTTSKSARCHCPEGFTGHSCERKLCSSNPCKGEGTCLIGAAEKIVCMCPYGKIGEKCEYGKFLSFFFFFYYRNIKFA